MLRKHRCAFTLVELLVVVAIITLLIAILLPTLGRARYVTRLATCASNLRQIGIAHTSYAADEFGWYPYGATETRLTKHGLKWMLPTGTHPSHTPMLAPYLGGVESMDARKNRVLQCAQGMYNLKDDASKRSQYLAFYANRINAQGSNQSAYYDTNSDGGWQKTWQYAVDETKLLRKVNETMYFNGYRNNFGWSTVNGEYNILASDWTTRWFGTTTAFTNHVWGSGYVQNQQMYWEEGDATVNYLLTDGSMQPFNFPVTNFRDTASMGAGTEGGAQTIIFPKEWAQ